MQDRLLTLEEVGEQLSVARSTVFKLVRDGQLATVKIGRSTRVTQSEVARFIADIQKEKR